MWGGLSQEGNHKDEQIAVIVTHQPSNSSQSKMRLETLRIKVSRENMSAAHSEQRNKPLWSEKESWRNWGTGRGGGVRHYPHESVSAER